MIRAKLLLDALDAYEISLHGVFVHRTLVSLHREIYAFLKPYRKKPDVVIPFNDFYTLCNLIHYGTKEIPDTKPEIEITDEIQKSIAKKESALLPLLREAILNNQSWLLFRRFFLTLQSLTNKQLFSHVTCQACFSIAREHPDNVVIYGSLVHELSMLQLRDNFHFQTLGHYLKTHALHPIKKAGLRHHVLCAFSRFNHEGMLSEENLMALFDTCGPEPVMVDMLIDLNRIGLLDLAIPELKKCFVAIAPISMHSFFHNGTYDLESVQHIVACWRRLAREGIQQSAALRAIVTVKLEAVKTSHRDNIDELTEAMIFAHRQKKLDIKVIGILERSAAHSPLKTAHSLAYGLELSPCQPRKV